MSKFGKRKWLVLILLLTMLYGLWISEAECGIILKAMVVNPSKTKTQKATLKAYLPLEAKPADILDLADLKIDYDVEKGLYYVYKQVTLKPGESLVRQIEIEDVWVIQEQGLKQLSEQAKEIVERLKDSNYFQAAVALSKDIDQKRIDIIKTQTEAVDALPQAHIAAYRANEKKLNEIKVNIADLEKMFLKYKLATARGAERVSVKASWRVILAVIIALGLLSFAFFIIWHKQAGVLQTTKHKEEEVLSEEEKL